MIFWWERTETYEWTMFNVIAYSLRNLKKQKIKAHLWKWSSIHVCHTPFRTGKISFIFCVFVSIHDSQPNTFFKWCEVTFVDYSSLSKYTVNVSSQYLLSLYIFIILYALFHTQKKKTKISRWNLTTREATTTLLGIFLVFLVFVFPCFLVHKIAHTGYAHRTPNKQKNTNDCKMGLRKSFEHF